MRQLPFLLIKMLSSTAIYVHASVIWTMHALKLWGVWWCVVFENQNIWKYQLVRHSPAITNLFSCFLYHFTSEIKSLLPNSWGCIIAQSFLKVLVIELSMFLVVKMEVWKIWKHQRVRHSLAITNLFSYHLYLLYIKSYERWCYSDIGISQDYPIVLHTNASCVA